MVWAAADKITAIVIDDEKEITNVLCDYLRLVSIDVVGFGYSGKDAVRLYEKYKPDIVFLDFHMPHFDGPYALFKIRRKYPLAHVIMITGDNSLDTIPKIEELKPNFIIHKPFNMTEILMLVKKLEPDKAKSIQIIDDRN